MISIRRQLEALLKVGVLFVMNCALRLAERRRRRQHVHTSIVQQLEAWK